VARVFLSHASADLGAALEIGDWLRADGHDVFLDRDLGWGIQVGQEWKQRLYRELRVADAVVCVVTGAFVASNWCAAEVGIADSLGCLLLPVRAEAEVVHPLMERLQYADYVASPDAARARLVGVLRGVDGGGGAGGREGDNPYPGLEAFTAGLARMFFGRAPEVRELSGRLRSAARRGGGIVAVAGPSGCGKSSLLRAGLLPALDSDPHWLVTPPLLPQDSPLAGIARALAVTANRLGLGWSLSEVQRILETDEDGLRVLAEELLVVRPGADGSRLLLAVDQGEELFTRARTGDREQVGRLLALAVAGPVRVVATLRSEFLDDLRGLHPLSDVAIDSYLLGPLGTDMLRLAIEEPARIAGLRLDRELTARLIGDTDTGQALPLLAFVLRQLADGLTRGGTLTIERYLSLGGVRGALAHHADAALAAAADASGLTAEQVIACLVRLVTVDGSGRRSQRRVRRADFSKPQQTALGVFVDHRILIADTDDDNQVWISTAHEALLTAWPPLDAAVAGHTAALHAARAVEQAAADWTAAGRPDSHLWEEERLAATLAILGLDERLTTSEGPGADLNADAQSFLDATSRRVQAAREQQNAARHRTRRLRNGVMGALAGLLFVTLAAGVAITQWRAATLTAVTLKMVAQADAARDADPATAMQLGAAAHYIEPGPKTAAGLVNTLTATRYAGTLTGASSPVHWVAFSPDGHTLATGSDELLLWDPTDHSSPRRLGQPLAGPTSTAGIVKGLSPDGRTLATAPDPEEGTVLLWDLTDPAAPERLGKPLTGIGGFVRFSPDARTLATGTDDLNGVLLWDLTDRAAPRLLGKTLKVDALAPSAVFSPDGRTLVTGTPRPGTPGMLLWDLTNRAAPRVLGKAPIGLDGRDVYSVAFSPDGDTLATGSEDGSVLLWNVGNRAAPRPESQPLTGHDSAVLSVAFSPDGNTLVAGGQDGTTLLWDFTDLGARGPGPALTSQRMSGHRNAVYSVAFSPDGHTLATGSADKTAILWDLTDHNAAQRLGPPPTPISGFVTFSPDGHTVASFNLGTGVLLWDLTDGNVPHRLGQPLTGGDNNHHPVVFSPDGRTLATASVNSGVRLWDLTDRASPRLLGQPLSGGSSWSLPVVFSPDGRTLAAGSIDSGVRLWDLTDRASPRLLGRPLTGPGDPPRALAFSPDGRTLAAGSDNGTITLWELTNPGAPRSLGQPLTGHNGSVNSVMFSPVGHTLASGSDDSTVLLWDLTDLGAPRRLGQPLTGPYGEVQVVFSPDGRTLASSGGAANTVQLWDLTDIDAPRRLGQPLTGNNGIYSVGFSPDGYTLAIGNHDAVIFWDLTALKTLRDNALQAACSRGGGGLDRATWNYYAPDIPYENVCRR
jgi:WD40 repeat protein